MDVLNSPGYLIDTLRMMYKANKVTKVQLQNMLSDNKITSEEYEYIVRKEGRVK